MKEIKILFILLFFVFSCKEENKTKDTSIAKSEDLPITTEVTVSLKIINLKQFPEEIEGCSCEFSTVDEKFPSRTMYM